MLSNSLFTSHLCFYLFLGSVIAPSSGASSLEAFKDNLRFSIDVSERSVDYQDKDQLGFTHVAGVDLHKVFNGKSGDVGTLVIQAYLTKLDNQLQHSGFFENEDDSQLVYRIVTFNFTKTQPWQPNIKLGHLEIPYGLEHNINTNGTLRDYGQGPNLGIKADWGISLNKQHEHFEYEISSTTGGGQSLQPDESSYVYSARIGSPRHFNQIVGLSAYQSKLATHHRDRIALDIQHYWGLFGLYGQLDRGNNNGITQNQGLVELNFRDSRELAILYIQSFYTVNNTIPHQQDKLTFAIGAQLDYRQAWDISAQFKWDQRTFDNQDKIKRVSVQFRYRF